MKEKDRTCPRTRFKNDLLAQLRKRREQGDRLIFCMEVNEEIYCKSIGKALTMSEDLQMIEAVGNYTGKKIGATFFRGTKPIDGVWVTYDVVTIGVCVMPASYHLKILRHSENFSNALAVDVFVHIHADYEPITLFSPLP